jgi:hypothetical protein
MWAQDTLDLDVFYSYGYKGRAMMAVRAPFAMADDSGLTGRIARIGGEDFEIVAISRQISGPIAAGEPIGIEVRRVGQGRAT